MPPLMSTAANTWLPEEVALVDDDIKLKFDPEAVVVSERVVIQLSLIHI